MVIGIGFGLRLWLQNPRLACVSTSSASPGWLGECLEQGRSKGSPAVEVGLAFPLAVSTVGTAAQVFRSTLAFLERHLGASASERYPRPAIDERRMKVLNKLVEPRGAPLIAAVTLDLDNDPLIALGKQ